jgi:glycine cleavage system H protein
MVQRKTVCWHKCKTLLKPVATIVKLFLPPTHRENVMSEIPGDLKFLKSHEWARIEDSGKITVGISDHAQGLLGDLVYVELPNVGDSVTAGNACAVVESVKAASDVYSPISGTVVAVNEALSDKPETINEDAYGEGWIFVVKPDDMDEMNDLLAPDDYAELLEDDDH